MRVLFDDRPARATVTGVGRYAATLPRCAGGATRHELWALSALDAPYDSPADETFGLPALLEREHFDLFHSPLFHLPPLLPTRCVVTVHDAIPAVRPDLTQEGFDRLFAGVRESAERAAAVVVPSESARRDLTRHAGLPGEKLRVVPETPADHFFRPLDRPRADLLLFVGSLEPRKNPELLLDALRAIPPRDRPGAVFAGPAAGFDLAAEAERRGLTAWVEHEGVVGDERLVELYATASALVFPSRYEGFGLPVVEAFACGTPVIASTAASVPEVAGDAAVLVDPDDPEALAEAIRELRDSPGRREALVAAGRARLGRHFSREAVRSRLAEVYDELEGAA